MSDTLHKAVMSCAKIALPRSVKRKRYIDNDSHGISFEAYANNKLLGTLLIGQGGICWRANKSRARRLTWTEFADAMTMRLQNRKPV